MDTSNEELSITSIEEFFNLFDYYIELDRLGQQDFFFIGCRAILNYIQARRLVAHHEQVEELLKSALLTIRQNSYQIVTHQDLLDFRSRFEALLFGL